MTQLERVLFVLYLFIPFFAQENPPLRINSTNKRNTIQQFISSLPDLLLPGLRPPRPRGARGPQPGPGRGAGPAGRQDVPGPVLGGQEGPGGPGRDWVRHAGVIQIRHHRVIQKEEIPGEREKGILSDCDIITLSTYCNNHQTLFSNILV